MPVRSLNSAVLTWPTPATVLPAARQWAEGLARERPEVVAVGCFGSYATGRWGVGSDLDVLIIVSDTDLPFERRNVRYAPLGLPVPCDVMTYTRDEWAQMVQEKRGAAAPAAGATLWLFSREGYSGGLDALSVAGDC